MITHDTHGRRRYRLLRTVAAGLLLAATLNGAALAGKPPPSDSGGLGSCAVTPNPVAVGAQYTINAWSLGANRSVNVFVQGSGGTNTFFRYTDASGSTSVTWYANWAGTNQVTVKSSGGRKTSVLATCSFSAY